MYKSALLFQDNAMFTQHLQLRSESIKATITTLFSQFPAAAPGAEEMREQLNEALAREKEHSVLLRTAIDEKESMEVRLEQASWRYMTAEKKLERAKSAQVLKLERAAMMGGNGDASSPTTSKKATPPKTEQGEVNGELENGVATAEAEAARAEAIAAAEKQKSQLEEIETENERLTNELSAARTKLASLSDDDYAETALFKTIKSQHEDAIKRVNDLEALNIELREEATKMHADRTSHKMRVDEEHRTNTADIEAQIARADNDLARIRDQRDEYHTELTIRRQAEETRRTSADQAKELAAARDSKITALESEIERLGLRLGDSSPPPLDIEDQDTEVLKKRIRALEAESTLLNRETRAIEDAFAKASATSAQKIGDAAAWEESKARLMADKAKADQKYFATMKAKDLQTNELRMLKAQNARSSEIVSQLKDTDGKTRELVANLEKQVSEARESSVRLEALLRQAEQRGKDAGLVAEGVKVQVEKLTELVVGKDKEVLGAGKAKREAEEELERAKARLDDARKQLDVLKKAKAGGPSTAAGGEDDWRVRFPSPRTCDISLVSQFFLDPLLTLFSGSESRHLPRLQRQHPQHRAQTLRAHLLLELRQGSDLESEPEVSELWEGVWEWGSYAYCPYVR